MGFPKSEASTEISEKRTSFDEIDITPEPPRDLISEDMRAAYCRGFSSGARNHIRISRELETRATLLQVKVRELQWQRKWDWGVQAVITVILTWLWLHK